ncbi:MAG: FIST N-terminal domain-containing protein [Promethearchaeota archaeon]
MLDASVGITTEKNSYLAGKKVAQKALDGMSSKPKLAILAIDSLTRRHFNNAEVVRGIREILGPNITLIGSTVNGIIVNDRFALRSIGLMLLGGDLLIDKTFNYNNSRLEYEGIAEKIYQQYLNLHQKDNSLMLMFQDGMKFPPEILAKQKTLNSRAVSMLSGLVKRFFKRQLEEFKETGMGMPSVQELLELLYTKGFDLPVIGNIATNVRDYDSVEFFNDEIGNDNVVGVLLSGVGSTKFGYGFAAGAESTGKICRVTKNIGNFLLRIEDKPALLGLCSTANIQKESLRELRGSNYLNYHLILGTREKIDDKDYVHLTATITDPNLEGLVNTGFPFDKVPNDIEIFQSNMQILHKTAETSVKQALSTISNPKFLLGFDCAIRFFAYGDNLPRIVKTINNTIDNDIPRMIVGSGGEILGTKDMNYYFNNFTFITLAGGD